MLEKDKPDPKEEIPTPQQLKDSWFPSSETYLTHRDAETNFIPSTTKELSTKEILEIFVKTAATIAGKPYLATYVCSVNGELVRGPSRYSFVPVGDDNTGAVFMIEDLGSKIIKPLEEKILHDIPNLVKPFHDHNEFMKWLGVREKPDFIQKGQVLVGTASFSQLALTPNNLMFVAVMSGGSSISARDILFLEELIGITAAQFEKALKINSRLIKGDFDL